MGSVLPSSSFKHTTPQSKDDLAVPIMDAANHEEIRAKHGHVTSRTLTLSSREEERLSLSPETSFQLAQTSSPSPLRGNLWRGVSADYLQDLESDGGENATVCLRRARLRPQSFDFGVSLDPPTKLIENFLHHQAATGNVCLDMDMNMIEKIPVETIAKDVSALHSVEELPDLLLTRASGLPEASLSCVNISSSSNTQAIHQPSRVLSESSRVFTHMNGQMESDDASDLRNRERLHDDSGDTSSSDDDSHAQQASARSSFNRLHARSRLFDHPPSALQVDIPASKPYIKSTQLKTGQLRSGLLQKSSFLGDVDEDDPFKDTDIPDDLKVTKCSFITIFQWISFVLIMGWLICSLTIPALIKRPLWSMALWKWALLTLLLFCGRLLSGWIIRILVIILERNFLLRKRVLYFVYGLRKGVRNCLWFAFAVLAWRLVLDPKVESTTNSNVLPTLTKVLNCLLIAAIVWLVKIFLVKVLASSFHVSTYFERIRESLFGQWLLETLAGPPAVEMEQEAKVLEELNDLRKAGATVPEGIMGKSGVQAGKIGVVSPGLSGLLAGPKKSGVVGAGKSGFMGIGGLPRLSSEKSMDKKGSQGEGITIGDLHKLNERNISAWNMKRLMNFVRYRGIYTLAHVIDQTAAAENQDNAQEVEIHSEWQAKALAKKIFRNVAKPGARYITRHDLSRFMLGPEVERALPLFEGAEETGKISKYALKDFAVHVVRERRALSLSLNDTKTAVKKLHRLVDVIVGLVILIVCLLVLGITTTHLLVVISSQLVLIVFIFGNTCKTVFEAIVFLFVMHPFDVGDRCVVDGNQLVVEEMNILSTLFSRNDGEKIWYPNSLLATKYIFNYYRTPDTGDSFLFVIDADTASDKISTLRDRIAKYIATKPNHWSRDFNLVVTSIEDNNKMNMELMLNHTINYSEDLERRIRKSELILEVKKMLHELGFGYRLLPQEVHLVSPSTRLVEEDRGGSHHLKAS